MTAKIDFPSLSLKSRKRKNLMTHSIQQMLHQSVPLLGDLVVRSILAWKDTKRRRRRRALSDDIG
jgi:hypothetical protein